MVLVAFGALTLALIAVWLPRVSPSRHAAQAWLLPGGLALIVALVIGLIDARGLLVLLCLAGACRAAHAERRPIAIVAHTIVLTLCAGLFAHALPGFDNPRVLDGVRLAPDAVPYTKYLNVDKGMAGLFLLGLYVPDRAASDEGARHAGGFAWRFGVMVATVIALALALGYVRWDPKLPSWWPTWLWSMVFLTALPEEALFRGVVQTWIERRLGGVPRAEIGAAVTAGMLFGLAHIAGGPAYALLSAVAGAGYGWIYASTRSLGAAIAAHAGLNAVHFFCFTYPALAAAS